MEPYYQHGSITLYNADCRDVLPCLRRQCADLLLTDPPYGTNWQSGRRKKQWDKIAGDDGSLDVSGVLKLALRVLRDKRHLYIFGRWDLSGLAVGGSSELIWDKSIPGLGNTALPWAPQHEPITFGVHIARPSGRKSGDGNTAARLRRGSVLRYARPNGATAKRHPTEKPVDLLRELIESSSRIGEMILDPFAGCGSTLVAALHEGRSAIGIECEEQYCEVAAERLSQVASWQAVCPG